MKQPEHYEERWNTTQEWKVVACCEGLSPVPSGHGEVPVGATAEDHDWIHGNAVAGVGVNVCSSYYQ